MLDRLQIKTLFMHQLHREMSIYIHQIGLITNGGWRRRGGLEVEVLGGASISHQFTTFSPEVLVRVKGK